MPQLLFRGKHYVENHHLTVPYSQLLPMPEKSLVEKPNFNDNVIIQGDNLLTLKSLLPIYEGRVKCIYIDPPYNTGNENWQYNDAVNSPFHQEWLGQVVGSDDLERHDKWLCMMMPRLKLLRELLREDGVIFISIDDNEAHNLRVLMDEVFGEANFVANVVWHSKYTVSNDTRYMSQQHEYLICFAKNLEHLPKLRLPRTSEMDERYTNPDNDTRGVWKATPLHAKSGSGESYHHTFQNGVTWTAPTGRYPRFSIETLKRLDNDNRLWFGKDGLSTPSVKTFLSEVGTTRVAGDVWRYEEVNHTHGANEQLAEIMGKGTFSTPKPVELIQQALRLVTTTSNHDIILDSFAGSGTTAQAVLDLNKEDGGNRCFVLIEMEDYADNLTAERVRRVINGIPNSKNTTLREGLGGTFSYFQLGKPFDAEAMFTQSNGELPSYENLARYVFYTATGAEFDEAHIQRDIHYIGESQHYHVFLYYAPDWDYLMNTGFTLNMLRNLPFGRDKERLVYAPSGYVDDDYLRGANVRFLRLPYEIYRYQGRKHAN
jgi:adenine-specific DNA-methyltransferase